MTWEDRIQAALLTGEFTTEDQELASDFETCAVGENKLDPYEQTVEKGYARDNDAYLHGMDFFYAVMGNNPEEAALVYKKIVRLAQASAGDQQLNAGGG